MLQKYNHQFKKHSDNNKQFNQMIQTIILQGGQGGMVSILMLAGMFAIMYFFMIRPQQKKAKEEKAFQGDLKRGSQVIVLLNKHDP